MAAIGDTFVVVVVPQNPRMDRDSRYYQLLVAKFCMVSFTQLPPTRFFGFEYRQPVPHPSIPQYLFPYSHPFLASSNPSPWDHIP